MKKSARELRRRNNKLDEKLTEENEEQMTDVVVYIRMSSLSDYHQEMVRNDLLEMVLSAQERGETFESVIGEDKKGFCDEIIESMPKKTKRDKIFELLDYFFMITAIMGMIKIVFSVESFDMVMAWIGGETPDYHITITAGEILSFGFLVIGALLLIKFWANEGVKEKKKGTKLVLVRDWLLGVLYFAVVLALTIFFTPVVGTIPVWAAAVLVLVMTVLERIMNECY